jgi:protoporphyrinogen oxidase
VKVAVVGGGALGIGLSLRLNTAGHEVTLYEAAPTLGGLASAWSIPVEGGEPVVWDRHYHVTLTSDRRTRALLADLGLEDELRFASTGTGYTAGDRLVPVNGPVDFLKLPGLSLVSKVRLGLTILRGTTIRDRDAMEAMPVATWLRRWSGDRAYRVFWLPLLRAKLGANHELASAAFIWSTIQRLFKARKAGIAEDQLGWVRGGYHTVFERAAAVLVERGVEVRTGVAVKAVRAGGVVETDGDTRTFDQVVVTAAAPIAVRLCPDLSDRERALLEGVTYQGIVCASLVLRRPVSPYYLTYITDDAAPFTAVVETTALVGPAEMGGRTLVYLPKYVLPDDPFLDATDDEVRARFLPYLQTMHPSIADDDVLAFRVSRVRQVLAVPTIDYSKHEPPMRTSVEGLVLASSANIVDGTLNVDETLSLVDRVVGVLCR